MRTTLMRGLVVATAVSAALAVPATAALADGGHGRGHHGGHARGHEWHGHWPGFRFFRSESATVPVPRPAQPAPPAVRPAPRPVVVVTVVRRPVVVAAATAPPVLPSPSAEAVAAPHLFVGTPTAAQAPTSGARTLAGVAAAAVVVTLIGLGFSVRRGLARVD